MSGWFSKRLIGSLVIAIIVAAIFFYFIPENIYNIRYSRLREENTELKELVEQLESDNQQLEQELNESLSTEGNRELRERVQELESINEELRQQLLAKGMTFEFRARLVTLRNPYWYAEQGYAQEAQQFWDQDVWERILNETVQDGYNAVIYWIEPWMKHAWQTFLIKHEEFPEARDYTVEQYNQIIEQVNWIFNKAHELGLKNFLFTYLIVTTPAFAAAHDMNKVMPMSPSVDLRHNLPDMGYHFGIRNELTRAFTEAAIAELFQTYSDLDGLYGAMGEAVPGKKSTWYKEAIVPGLKRSGRNPIFIVLNWMMPLEDFLEDIAPKEVYNNTWLGVMPNGEVFTDAKPYPTYVSWVEKAGIPTIMHIHATNFEAGFPFNSPKLAYETIKEYQKFDNVVGFIGGSGGQLFQKALNYYGENLAEPYSDEPWITILEQQFGDKAAAEHFLKAYDASARISPELHALAWVPQDIGISHILLLPYWYWTEQDPRWDYLTSPSQGGFLLPVRYYAKVVATLGPMFRDNSGEDYLRNTDHPGAQELFWGLADYPITPEAHMRKIRLLGEEALREADLAMKTVKTNVDEATTVYNYMKAYKLLADYYERKVLAAISALVYSFGGPEEYKTEAERLADEAVQLYETAINFIWENIDNKSGNIKGRWSGRYYTLPGLIEQERNERGQLATLFKWP